MLGGTIKEMMEAEMSRHLGYKKSERSESDNARNGHKSKRVKSSYGNFSVEVPQNRKSTFAPQVIPKPHYSVRDNGLVRKLVAYVILAINCDGRKEVLSIEIGENESAKYWLGILNS